MTTIKLTQEQVASICNPVSVYHQELVETMQMAHAKEIVKLERRWLVKVDRALVKAADWKARHQDTRKQLLEARAEVHELKRKLRNGEWE